MVLRTDRVPHVDKVTAADVNNISQVVNDNDAAAMHLANPETITGAKTFTVPVSVPPPQDADDAANRDYVLGLSDKYFAMTVSGSLVTGQLVPVFPIPFACTLTSVVMRLVTAPMGQAAIFDVNLNGRGSGDTIFTDAAKKPTVAAGGFLDTTPGADAARRTYAAGDWLAFDIDQAGSTTPGADLTIILALRPA